MEQGNTGPPLRRALPFLNALAVFESAARLNGFTRAAAEFDAADVDLSIRYGGGSWPRHSSQQLAQEIIIAACSPGFARSHGLTGETPVRELATLPLIQYEATARDAYDWRHWFAQAGVR